MHPAALRARPRRRGAWRGMKYLKALNPAKTVHGCVKVTHHAPCCTSRSAAATRRMARRARPRSRSSSATCSCCASCRPQAQHSRQALKGRHGVRSSTRLWGGCFGWEKQTSVTFSKHPATAPRNSTTVQEAEVVEANAWMEAHCQALCLIGSTEPWSETAARYCSGVLHQRGVHQCYGKLVQQSHLASQCAAQCLK